MARNGSSINGVSPSLPVKDPMSSPAIKDTQTFLKLSPAAVDSKPVGELSSPYDPSTSQRTRRGTSYTDLDLSEKTGGRVRESSVDDVEYVTVRRQ